jgi:hypothetical protein
MEVYAFARLQTKTRHDNIFLVKRQIILGLAVTFAALVTNAGGQATGGARQTWKPVDFAIVKYNDEAPKSWNLYHMERKGVLLLHLWKRYLLVDLKEEEVYDIDPDTVRPAGENVEWNVADKPAESIESGEWKTRDVGPMRRVRFRLGKGGNVVELQIPLLANGKPAY